jgi:hypothetical protein
MQGITIYPHIQLEKRFRGSNSAQNARRQRMFGARILDQVVNE